MAVDRVAWASAYARQARSDLAVFDLLAVNSQVEPCHRLHYLQMTAEKIAKAYRLRDTETAEERLLREHVGFTRFVETFMRSRQVAAMLGHRPRRRRAVSREMRRFAREIEALAPAVDDERRPENCEYPWQRGDTVLVPCDYSFPALSRLATPAGLAFLKLVRMAVTDFERFAI